MWYRQLIQEQDKRASKKGIATWQYLFEVLFDRPSNDDFAEGAKNCPLYILNI